MQCDAIRRVRRGAVRATRLRKRRGLCGAACAMRCGVCGAARRVQGGAARRRGRTRFGAELAESYRSVVTLLAYLRVYAEFDSAAPFDITWPTVKERPRGAARRRKKLPMRE